MQFKVMAETMSDTEVAFIFHLVYPCGKLGKIGCDRSGNAINVCYSLSDEPDNVVHQIDFLPDDIYLLSDDGLPEEIPMEECEILYQSRQFMVAKGYSELWLNNPYVEI